MIAGKPLLDIPVHFQTLAKRFLQVCSLAGIIIGDPAHVAHGISRPRFKPAAHHKMSQGVLELITLRRGEMRWRLASSEMAPQQACPQR
jgi:hypothetical protein